MKRALALILLILTGPDGLIAQEALRINKDQLYNQTGQGEAFYLFDEPGLAEPKTVYEQGYDKTFGPAEILIDLRALHRWHHLRFFDTFGRGKLEIYLGKPGAWQKLASPITSSYRQWRQIDLKHTEAQFLRLLFVDEQAKVAELELYATALAEAPPRPDPALQKEPIYPVMDHFWGLNILHNDAPELIQELGFALREYHRWDWDQRGENLAFQPSYAGNWRFDDFYARMHKAGLAITPCLQSTAQYLLPEGKDREAKPAQGDPSDPQSYQAHAEYLRQFTVRYGAQKHSFSALRLRDDQPPRSGLNYLHSIEQWNEPDKWWKGRSAYFRPFEYAAMLSADYDGHEGSLGPKAGVKQADPNLPVVMAGLAELNLNYLRSVKLWSDHHRQTGFPAEVLNFHHYSHSSGGAGNLRRGISPEADSLYSKLRRIVRWRDAHLPQQQLWLSEFGYDSNSASPQGLEANPHYAPEALRSAWIIRTYLMAYAAGFDRAYLYMLRDVNSQGKGKYQSSGLSLDLNSKGQKKEGYRLLQQFSSLLKGYRLVERRLWNADGIYHLVFAKAEEKKRLHLLWSSRDEKAPQRADIRIAGKAEVYQLAKGHWVSFKKTAPLELGALPLVIREKENQ